MRFYAAAATDAVQVIGKELNITYVVLGISLAALAIAWFLRSQVLAASEGTAKMIEIAEAVHHWNLSRRGEVTPQPPDWDLSTLKCGAELA